MKVSGYACDQCEKFSENQDGWYVITNGDLIIEVCSLQCVRKFAQDGMRALGQLEGRRAVEVDEEIHVNGNGSNGVRGLHVDKHTGNVIDEDGKVECQYCHKRFARKYIGNHLRTQHKIRGGITGRVRLQSHERNASV